MQIRMLHAKLHHARVTAADVEYVGSITIDADLLRQSGMVPYQEVLVADVENGARFETYIIPGEAGSGVIVVNGAAAHLVNLGDRLIVLAFALVEYPPPPDWSAQVLVLDEANRVARVESEAHFG